MSPPAPGGSEDDALLAELRETNRLLRLNIQIQSRFRERFLAGLWTGLGTVIGATVLIGVLVRVLAPLAKAEVVGPYIQKIQEQLERPRPGSATNGSETGANGG